MPRVPRKQDTAVPVIVNNGVLVQSTDRQCVIDSSRKLYLPFLALTDAVPYLHNPHQYQLEAKITMVNENDNKGEGLKVQAQLVRKSFERQIPLDIRDIIYAYTLIPESLHFCLHI